MKLYAIACTFQTTEGGEKFAGMAVCSDPDTPETFIFPDGSPYIGKEIWTYSLHHHQPWACIHN